MGSRASDGPGRDPVGPDRDPSGEGERAEGAGRYVRRGEVGRGAMGVVYRVRDDDLDRELAMKVLLERASSGGGDDTLERRKLARFLEEAKITGQLDHPGVVPVHELGVDERGRTYFTMRLVQGHDLEEVIERLHAGDEEWNLTRVVGVIQRVCEAVAFAHERGIVHRDLKPSNVMVGSLGETYVMDWGLAKDLQRGDVHDIRLRAEVAEGADGGDSLTTMDGDVVGTPAYMAPEQASGEVGAVGVRSDVYSVGAMLYHVLAGAGPYMTRGARTPQRLVLEVLRRRPPEPIERLAPGAPAELLAICAKAMRRDPAERYRDLADMADDLRAYLELRVVRAHGAGALAQLRKWVQRNRALAVSLAAALLAVVGGLAAVGVVQAQGRRAAEAATRRQELLTRETEAARAEEARAREEADRERVRAEALVVEQRRFATGGDARELIARERTLWPVHADTVPAMDGWLSEVEEVLGREDEIRGALAELRGRALAYGEEDRRADRQAILAEEFPRRKRLIELGQGIPGLKRELELMRDETGPGAEAERAELEAILARAVAERDEHEAVLGARRTYRFADVADLRTHGRLAAIVADLERLAEVRERLAARRRLAAEIAQRTLTGADARRRWDEAIAGVAASPLYGDVALEPIHGLLPLGPDPESGLWEFAHLASGEPQERGADGRFVVSGASGMVLVLVPGGKFTMGCSNREDHVPAAQSSSCTSFEHEPTAVGLGPFLVAKHELTRGQWTRATGSDPSYCRNFGSLDDPARPVEHVTWRQVMDVLACYGLTLPTEAQWEYACRGGTDTVFSFGDDPDGMADHGNVADETLRRNRNQAPQGAGYWSDDHFWTAPVGLFAPNPFGLHDVHGNVSELCRDDFRPGLEGERDPVDGGTGEDPAQLWVPYRGGSWEYPPGAARCSDRQYLEKYDLVRAVGTNTGARAARALR